MVMSAPTRISEHWPYVREMADNMSQQKRLTEAELAAEYWRANALGWMHEDAGEFTRAEQHSTESSIFRRFATLPHYDEEQS